MRKLQTATAIAASLLVGASAHAYDLSKVSDENKVAMLAGITVHAEMCGKPQSATVQSIRDELKDDENINMGDVRVKAAEYTVEAALDTGAWCAKADKYLVSLDKADKPNPSTPVASAPATPALATTKDGMPDYEDKGYTCDKDTIEGHLSGLIERSAAGTAYGLRLIYVKGDPVETLRVTEELRCRVTIVTTRSTSKGIFRFVVEDGHSLVAWEPGKKK